MIADTKEMDRILQSKGYKITLQRRSVLDVILNNRGSHLSAEEIYEGVGKTNLDIGFSTVYRTLDLFERMGFIQHELFDDGPKRYHMSDHDEKRGHCHLVCEVCGEIIDVHKDVIQLFKDDILSEKGFAMTKQKVQIFGVCKKCLNKKGIKVNKNV